MFSIDNSWYLKEMKCAVWCQTGIYLAKKEWKGSKVVPGGDIVITWQRGHFWNKPKSPFYKVYKYWAVTEHICFIPLQQFELSQQCCLMTPITYKPLHYFTLNSFYIDVHANLVQVHKYRVSRILGHLNFGIYSGSDWEKAESTGSAEFFFSASDFPPNVYGFPPKYEPCMCKIQIT